jgi:hypothetical protein
MGKGSQSHSCTVTVRFSYLDGRLVVENSGIRNGDKVYKSGVINMHMSQH